MKLHHALFITLFLLMALWIADAVQDAREAQASELEAWAEVQTLRSTLAAMKGTLEL